MMPSRDVVRDLLPLYVAAAPVLAAEVEALRNSDSTATPVPARAADGDRVAQARIREAVRTRSVLLGIAIPALVAGVGCWVGWFLLGRRISRNA